MSDERRHPPSAARLREAHQMGRFARSHELTAACVLLSLALVAPECVGRLQSGFQMLVESSYSTPVQTTDDLDRWASQVEGLGAVLLSIAALAVAVVGAAILGNALQSGFRFGFRAPAGRITAGHSPLRNGAARIGGAALSWLRFSACGIACLWTCYRALPEMSAWNHLSTPALAAEWGSLLSRLSWLLGLVLIGFAALDYLLARRRFLNGLAMTDEDLRREAASHQPANRRHARPRSTDAAAPVHHAVET